MYLLEIKDLKTLHVVALICLVFIVDVQLVYAQSTEICIYTTNSGAIKQVNSLSSIPSRYRKASKCFKSRQGTRLAKPEDIALEGTQRKEEMSSPVGHIDLRWPRKVEVVFGKTPKRAMVDAARAVSRALKSGGFPKEVRNLDLKWHIVFMDEKLSESQIPNKLITNCNPGWMTPPSNIYIVSQRVVAGCSGRKAALHYVADGELAKVLIHEMGHAVEHQLLKNGATRNRMRAEGFATWFEQYGSGFSNAIRKGSILKDDLKRARRAIKKSPNFFNFNSSADDYARASMYFNTIVARFKIRGLMRVYRNMKEEKHSFFTAIQEELGWSKSHLEKELRRFVGR